MLRGLTAFLLAIGMVSPLCCCAHGTANGRVEQRCCGNGSGDVGDGREGEFPECPCREAKAWDKQTGKLEVPQPGDERLASVSSAGRGWIGSFIGSESVKVAAGCVSQTPTRDRNAPHRLCVFLL